MNRPDQLSQFDMKGQTNTDCIDADLSESMIALIFNSDGLYQEYEILFTCK